MNQTLREPSVRELFHAAWGRNLHIGLFEEESLSVPQAAAAANQRMAELAAPSQDQRILEVGCGFADASQMLARRFGCEAIAVDNAVWRLSGADRASLSGGETESERGSASVRLAAAEHGRLPFADESFDLVWAAETLGYAADMSATLGDIARVLKPGGRFVFLEWFGSALLSPGPILRLYGAAHLWPQRRWRSELASAGFEVAQFADWTMHARATYARLGQAFAADAGRFASAAVAKSNMEQRLLWIDRAALGSIMAVVHKKG